MEKGRSGVTAPPYTQKLQDVDGGEFVPTIKSYNNEHFLLSPQGRLIRILCEFEEPAGRLRRHKVRSTVLFFGSARAMSAEEHRLTVQKYEASLAVAENDEARVKVRHELHQLQRTQWMCEWVNKVRDMSRMIAEFAIGHRDLINASFTHMPDYFRPTLSDVNKDSSMSLLEDDFLDLVVTTGGGPGFMEAANEGAASVESSATMGMGISLPFEKGLNRHITPDLAFEFHYFFTRKFWMMYSCRAIVIAPGGFGTLDELFELLTLRQTGKIPDLPIVLFCSQFWKTVVNWDALVEFGTVSKGEVDALCFADTAEEAAEFIKSFFLAQA
ncbi:lysine decarboxylase domain-containing protein [Trypanosoma rangeli]|uniref:Lysine decarboxylase domain-containing protein n=1 Tax=Trypanosoma rangeli TaxID=5698 RepID=A0A422MT26_TRYRA|nr:lysine decarboxylase domain-containing protein [Trypanosoma rangeli]RNE96351.1 lysine decarboxylase domain-containing protein [Trypanosoma rangeli]|eukprot:RNE96351.1 lysine decarboxylase domain-containing protein [Trypanosoma rangeli]